jgi:competence protein ComEC
MLQRRFALLALVAFGSACGGPPASSAPPPEGQSYSDYLAEGDKSASQPKVAATERVAADAMLMHFIDVGQGAATLLEFPCGAILIDTGGEKNELFDSQSSLLAYLNQFFARRRDLDRTLDSLIITHPHIDHTRSIAAVLQQFRVRNIVDNGDVRDDLGGRPQIEMHAWLQRRNQEIAKANRRRRQRGRGKRVPKSEPMVGHLDVSSADVGSEGLSSPAVDAVAACPSSPVDPEVRVLWGSRMGLEEKGHNPNNDSIVLRVDYGESSALLAGDIELLAMAWMTKHYAAQPELLDADVYYVPHHGSRNSTSEHWVSLISPQLAVISMGPYGRHLGTHPEYSARAFGHPNLNAIEHLIDGEGARDMLRRADPIDVQIGLKGAWKERPSQFKPQRIEKAIYATGWDGHVVVHASPEGQYEVQTLGAKRLAHKANTP